MINRQENRQRSSARKARPSTRTETGEAHQRFIDTVVAEHRLRTGEKYAVHPGDPPAVQRLIKQGVQPTEKQIRSHYRRAADSEWHCKNLTIRYLAVHWSEFAQTVDEFDGPSTFTPPPWTPPAEAEQRP